MRLSSLVVTLGLVCSLLHARIGESCAACERRYGAPLRTSEEGSLVTYRSHRLSVVIHFSAGVADMLSFQKLPSQADTAVRPFSETEVQELLEDNAGGRIWVPAGGSSALSVWRTEDGALRAVLDSASSHLMVYTEAFAASGDPGAL